MYTPFTRLSRAQVRRRWFPKVTVTVLEPVKLTVDPALKGQHRRQAAGAALYEIMSNLVYRTTSIERTVTEALIEAAEIHGMGRVAVEDPIAGDAQLSQAADGRAHPRRKAYATRAGGQADRSDAAER